MNYEEKQIRNKEFDSLVDFLETDIPEKIINMIKESEIDTMALQLITPLLSMGADEKWYELSDNICRTKENPEMWLNMTVDAFCDSKDADGVSDAYNASVTEDDYLENLVSIPESDSRKVTANVAESDSRKVTANVAESDSRKVTANVAESDSRKVAANVAESDSRKVTANVAENDSREVTASMAESDSKKAAAGMAENDFEEAAVSTIMNYMENQLKEETPSIDAATILINQAVEVRDNLNRYIDKIKNLENVAVSQKQLLNQQMMQINSQKEEIAMLKEQIEFYKEQLSDKTAKEQRTNNLLEQLAKIQNMGEMQIG